MRDSNSCWLGSGNKVSTLFPTINNATRPSSAPRPWDSTYDYTFFIGASLKGGAVFSFSRRSYYAKLGMVAEEDNTSHQQHKFHFPTTLFLGRRPRPAPPPPTQTQTMRLALSLARNLQSRTTASAMSAAAARRRAIVDSSPRSFATLSNNNNNKNNNNNNNNSNNSNNSNNHQGIIIGGGIKSNDRNGNVVGRDDGSSNGRRRAYTTHSQLPSEHQMVYEMCRKFADEELSPNAGRWDREHSFPTEAVEKLVSFVFFAICWGKYRQGGLVIRSLGALCHLLAAVGEMIYMLFFWISPDPQPPICTSSRRECWQLEYYLVHSLKCNVIHETHSQ